MAFVTYQQKYDEENALFFGSTEPAALEESARRLERMARSQYVLPELKERAEALAFRVRAKRYVLLYFGDYGEELYAEATAFFSRAAEVCTEKNYARTLDSLRKLRTLFEGAHAIVADSDAFLLRVRNRQGDPVTDDLSVFASVEETIRGKIAAAGELQDTELFARGVQLPSPKEQLIADLQFELDGLRVASGKVSKRKEEALLADCVRPLSEEYGDFIEYYPLLGEGEGGISGAIALNTPFPREAQLAVIQWAKKRSREALSLRCEELSGQTPEEIAQIFTVLCARKADYLLVGFSSCREPSARTAILQGVVTLGKSGARAYLLDVEGKNALYGELFDFAKGAEGFSVNEVSYHFLTLPYYRDVLALLIEKGAVSAESELKEIASSVAFMGYEGLNAALTAHAQGKSWKEAAISHSLKNRPRAMKYLAAVSAQYLLVDIEWGTFTELEPRAAEKRKHVDYDDVKVRNPVNIRKILQSEMTVFEKCGAIARYCTLYGDDVSVWQVLDKEEKSIRITEATQLVMRTLGVPLLPEVRVLSDEEWKKEDRNDSAGGQCCNGGQSIVYRESCAQSYDWTIGTICHECFHAFQHMAISTGWREWYFAELGVTKGRLPEWEYNFRNYFSSSSPKGYLVEIVECDARAFEHDCVEASANYWNMIDFE